MRRAQQALEDEPWIGLWAELAVLAHLTGWPAPVPVPAALAAARALGARTLQCAISRAADAAAASSPAIPSPRALAAHASDVLRARTESGEWLCAAEEPDWLLDTVTKGVAEEVLRPTTTGQTAAPADLLTRFIDCQWPLQYLSRFALPARRDLDRSGEPASDCSWGRHSRR